MTFISGAISVRFSWRYITFGIVFFMVSYDLMLKGNKN